MTVHAGTSEAHLLGIFCSDGWGDMTKKKLHTAHAQFCLNISWHCNLTVYFGRMPGFTVNRSTPKKVRRQSQKLPLSYCCSVIFVFHCHSKVFTDAVAVPLHHCLQYLHHLKLNRSVKVLNSRPFPVSVLELLFGKNIYDNKWKGEKKKKKKVDSVLSV